MANFRDDYLFDPLSSFRQLHMDGRAADGGVDLLPRHNIHHDNTNKVLLAAESVHRLLLLEQ